MEKLKVANSFNQRWPVVFTLQLALMYVSWLESLYTSKIWGIKQITFKMITYGLFEGRKFNLKLWYFSSDSFSVLLQQPINVIEQSCSPHPNAASGASVWGI